MGSKSNYLEAKVQDLVLGGVAFSAPGTVYVGLFSVTPSDAGGGTEATGTGYARVSKTNNLTNWPAASGEPTTKSNGTAVDFGTAGGTWSSGSNMVAFGVYDAAEGGNLLVWGALTVPKPVYSGDPVSFAIGALTWTED